MLRRTPGSDALADVLPYIIGLTRPRYHDGDELPGWRVAHDPDPTLTTPGGHANPGMAHGVTAGLLALLANATRQGIVVDGQIKAIETPTAWFDRWRQTSSDGPWWPNWLTRQERDNGSEER